MPPLSVCQPAVYGVNTSEDAVVFTEGNVGRFIQHAGNMRIEKGRWRTAFRCRELAPVTGDDYFRWREGHTQNAMWYLPLAGQGTHYIGVGEPRIVESSAGRLFSLTLRNNTFEVEDVSGGNVGYPHLMLAWLCQAENYIIRTDGKSQSQIWDGVNPVVFSTGYSRNNKTSAKFPNFAGPTIYAGGRLWTTLFDRRIYVGNSLHQLDQINATDLLKFIDQTYDYLNVYFAPPTDDGDIVALCASVNASNGDSRAQGEVLAMCNGPSIWGVQLGVPREQWPIASMRHSRSKETSATGPNAFHVRDGDIIMRSSKGIESLNLLARERGTLGNPAIDLGADMSAILERDDEASLIFASMINPPRWNRLLCTVSPQINEARHFHLGYISANFNPMGQRIPQSYAWEGLHTLPAAMGRIVQFLYARIEGKTRVVAIVDKGDSKGIVELTEEEGDHLLADGSSKPIEWFLLTKKLSAGGLHRKSTFGGAWLRLDNMLSAVNIEVHVRASTHLAYKLCKRIEVKPKPRKDDVLGCGTSAERSISLGPIASAFKDAHWIQILIKGIGVCTVDLAIRPDQASEPDEIPDKDCVLAESPPVCDFDIFYAAL